ncbi:hypothetical protein HGO34_19215 [Agrobacterium vitis]|uniref:Uncharacterized protein n=1 Tax=Agrobacterium vitis TaxID=373 RepID=A0A109CZN7_AGRVI|nr:hypothetical protein [Agrobacterium vitis]MCF1500550.1 hypothetical protein [Allorhizobium sp. Av2]KAA3516094.1 hypothetical protein DXM22_11620 [Agrobacterium vitis]KAA3520896.1 hypothetical protein DXT89_24570 [Agrobacterium vitis]MBF2716295.1 hypothetical protein [Agrobacterium vitis]MCE6077952.1 hypothetical protein [Agrobacterium vitis]
MSNPITSFFSSLIKSVKAEMSDRKKYKQARLQRLNAPAADKKVEPTRANTRNKAARQARRVTRNRG